MKKNIRNLVFLAILSVFCLGFSLGLSILLSSAIKETPVRQKNIQNTVVNAVSILDVKGVMSMTAVNYLPYEFARMDEVFEGKKSMGKPAKRGTYRFYIDTLTFEEQDMAYSLNHLLSPDGYWHLTMYIPPVYSACSVFVQSQNKEYVGGIEDYNLAYYITYSTPDETDEDAVHATETSPLFVDVPISADGRFSRECIVTIHYETENDNFVGLSSNVLIGEDAAVRKAVSGNRATLLIGALLAIATFLLFIFICVLKHSLAFVPQLIFSASIFLLLISTFMMLSSTPATWLLLGMRSCSLGFMLLAGSLYLPAKIKKIPVLYVAAVFAVAASVLALVSSFCTVAATYLKVVLAYTVFVGLCSLMIVGFTVFDVVKGKQLGLRLNGIIACIVVISALLFYKMPQFIIMSPQFWLCIGMLIIALVLGFRGFVAAEVRNRHLTKNLEQEVKLQTKNLQDIISERDKILLYVGHDMKKSISNMYDILLDLRQHAPPDMICKVDNLLHKSAEMKRDFSDVASYGRRNYVAETSEVIDLCRMTRRITDELRPDCEANGIILFVSLPEKADVYAKKVALESVITNIVLNAIEHSDCSKLLVNVVKVKDMCKINIVDNGKGIKEGMNIFEPFVSGENKGNNSGLGLFLAKAAVESMHGTLSFERKDGLTIFSATLPLA